MLSGIPESRFYMWRTLFAVAHADQHLSSEEISYMANVMEDVDFSPEQERVLKDDIKNPKNIEAMFAGITDRRDRIEFFDFAREIILVDGHYAVEEQQILIKLTREHYKNTNVDDLVGKVDLALEEDDDSGREAVYFSGQGKSRSVKDMLLSFRSLWDGD